MLKLNPFFAHPIGSLHGPITSLLQAFLSPYMCWEHMQFNWSYGVSCSNGYQFYVHPKNDTMEAPTDAGVGHAIFVFHQWKICTVMRGSWWCVHSATCPFNKRISEQYALWNSVFRPNSQYLGWLLCLPLDLWLLVHTLKKMRKHTRKKHGKKDLVNLRLHWWSDWWR